MRIAELLNQYTFHDSLVERIQYDQGMHLLRMTVDFCFWMQEDYADTEPETGLITLTFENVTNYQGLIGKLDDYSILDFCYADGQVRINILDDFHDALYEVSFQAEEAVLTIM